MFDQRGWKVGTVITDPSTEITRLQAALAISEADMRRLREAANRLIFLCDRKDPTVDAETAYAWMDEYEAALDALRAALEREEPPE